MKSAILHDASNVFFCARVGFFESFYFLAVLGKMLSSTIRSPHTWMLSVAAAATATTMKPRKELQEHFQDAIVCQYSEEEHNFEEMEGFVEVQKEEENNDEHRFVPVCYESKKDAADTCSYRKEYKQDDDDLEDMEPFPTAKNNENKYNVDFFRKWEQSLRAKLILNGILPSDPKRLPGDDDEKHSNNNTLLLKSSSTAVQDAKNALDQASRLLEQLKKRQPPPSPAEIDQASKVVQAATTTLNDTLATCQVVANTILQQGYYQNILLSPGFNDHDFVTLLALVHGTADKLAAWCDQGEGHAQQLVQVLQAPDTLRLWWAAGGPNSGNYGPAAAIAARLSSSAKDDPILQRLANAVALELCGPLEKNPVYNHPIDPVMRYQHYEQAYLQGELDPAFDSFSIWELRMVVNSDAPESELTWGRDSLKNYRPDIVLSSDPQWRYTFVVRTDVAYQDPTYWKDHPTYAQILSGGGKCGPRAWYGRFITKAFGIPTWGVQQPGHAAMARWTSSPEKGWMTCLGAGFEYSFWNDRCGLDFYLETQARKESCNGMDDGIAAKNMGGNTDHDMAFWQLVLRLEGMARIMGENDNSVRGKMLPDPQQLWYALSLMQRQRIVTNAPKSDHNKETKRQSGQSNCVTDVHNQIAALLSDHHQTPSTSRVMVQDDDGTIIIPATSCSKPTESTKDVLFMKSFLGGGQLFIGHNCEVEYTLDHDILSASIGHTRTRRRKTCKAANTSSLTATTYQMSLYMTTVHRGENPMMLTVTTNNDTVFLVAVPVPYTEGMWLETEPVVFDLGGADGKDPVIAKLNFERKSMLGGIAVKYIKLTPTSNNTHQCDLTTPMHLV